MHYENKISLQIPAADQKRITESLQTVQELLKPYLIALSQEQRRAIPKMGDGSIPFVEKAFEYAQTNPQLVPAYLNLGEFKIDLEAVYTLSGMLRTVEALQQGLSDTNMLAGSEAYTAALTYYNSVKQGAKANVPGAKVVEEDLKKRFEKSRTAPAKTSVVEV